MAANLDPKSFYRFQRAQDEAASAYYDCELSVFPLVLVLSARLRLRL